MLTHFYTRRRNATNKSCLFDAKFFEFEEFSIDPFFLGSIQPQHAVVVKDFFHLGPRLSSLEIVSLVLQLVPKSVWYHIPMTGRMVSQQILSHILPTIT